MKTVIDVLDLMVSLAQRRPIFHSEADFQHEFAWLAREHLPDLEIRLEHPLPGPGNGAVDILLRKNGSVVGIELKYLCQQVSINVGGDDFALKPQGAQDIRRYDVLKDVERMEQFVRARPSAQAAVIVLTNDPAYWTGPKSDTTCDAAFALREGRSIRGTLGWSEQTGAGTMRGREKPLHLTQQHDVAWKEYSRVPGRFGLFRFLHFAVSADLTAQTPIAALVET